MPALSPCRPEIGMAQHGQNTLLCGEWVALAGMIDRLPASNIDAWMTES
jgi:hypothetical protein